MTHRASHDTTARAHASTHTRTHRVQACPRSLSPIIHDRVRSRSISRAAARSMPGWGFCQSLSFVYSGTMPSGGYGRE